MMTRRHLLTTTCAGLLLPSWSQQSEAADSPWAIYLNGRSEVKLTTPSELGFPSTASRITFSYCYAGRPSTVGLPPLLMFIGDDASNVSLGVAHWFRSDGKAFLQVYSSPPGPYDPNHPKGSLQYDSPYGAIPYDDRYHQVVGHIDTSSQQVTVMIDGTKAPGQVYTCPSFVQRWSSITRVDVGGVVLKSSLATHVGNLAEVWLTVGDNINITDPKVMAHFWDKKNGIPVRQSTDGKNFVPGINPHVYLSGPKSMFYRNGAKAVYSFDTMTDRADFNYVGTITTADDDPWSRTTGAAPSPLIDGDLHASPPPIVAIHAGRRHLVSQE